MTERLKDPRSEVAARMRTSVLLAAQGWRDHAALDRLAEPLMKRPPGRRPAEPRMWLHELCYQAASRDEPGVWSWS